MDEPAGFGDKKILREVCLRRDRSYLFSLPLDSINVLHNHPHLAERTHAGRPSLAGFKIFSQTVLECLAKGVGSGLIPVPVPVPMPGRGRKKTRRCMYVCMNVLTYIRTENVFRVSTTYIKYYIRLPMISAND